MYDSIDKQSLASDTIDASDGLSVIRSKPKDKQKNLVDRLKLVIPWRSLKKTKLELMQDKINYLKRHIQIKDDELRSMSATNEECLKNLLEGMKMERKDMMLEMQAMEDRFEIVTTELEEARKIAKDAIATKEVYAKKIRDFEAKVISMSPSGETECCCKCKKNVYETNTKPQDDEMNGLTNEVKSDCNNSFQESLSSSSIQPCEENLDIIFDLYDANRRGTLIQAETNFGLQAVGLYPNKEYIDETTKDLDLAFPLSFPEFRQTVEALKNSSCKRGLSTVPYARRGLTLNQLKDIQAGLVATGWLQSICDDFNRDHEKDIQEGKEFAMKPNLYTMDKVFVRDVTNIEEIMREDIPEDVLKATKVPGVPDHKCCFSQLLNPDGLNVDFFVSHYWGHPFDQTVKALSNFAEEVYREIGKVSPDEVVFWISIFSLNQHTKEEMGETPEEGPFNAALANSKHGAVMILDNGAEPLQRIWCLYEISRAKHFNKTFQLIVDEGTLDNMNVETLEDISDKMLKVRAYNANASDEIDKLKIHYQIVDTKNKNALGSTFEDFKLMYHRVKESCFEDFDANVCSLIGTPLLCAGLKLKSKEVCYRAMGMGAMVTVDEMTQLDVQADIKVKTRYGLCGLHILFARMGRLGELQYILDLGADINEKGDEDGRTALHWAAINGRVGTVTVLLDRGARIGDVDNNSESALHLAAGVGHTTIVKILLERDADINERGCNDDMTALHYAASFGHQETVTALLDRGARLDEKDNSGDTALHYATTFGHMETLTLLLERGATIGDKNNDGWTALYLAVVSGHTDTVILFLDWGFDVDAKLSDGNTSLHIAAGMGHTKMLTLLLDRGAAIEGKNDDGDTAFQVAASLGQKEIVKLLRKRGAEDADTE